MKYYKKKIFREELESKAKEFVLNSFVAFSDRSGLEEKWENWDKLYNNISTEKFYEGTANLFPPETRSACKTLINFADEVLFNADPPFRIKGVGGTGDVEKSEALSVLINWQISRAKVRMKMRRMLENLVKYGIVIVKVPWLLREKYILDDGRERKKVKEHIGVAEKPQITKRLKTLYDNIDFQVKKINSMYWNYFEEWDNQRIIIERIETDWNHLKTMERAGIYHGVDRLMVQDSLKKDNSEQRVSRKWAHIQDLTGLSDTCETKEKKYELLEAWCNFDIDNDGIDEECVIVLANREHVIRLEVNPYDIQEKPYLHVAWDAIEDTSLGVGVPQMAEGSQIALNDFTNQIMDNITQILNCMKVVDDLAEIPDSQLKSRQNGIIKSKTGVNAVQFLRPPSTAREGLQAVIMMKEDIRQSSGATMSLQGMPARAGTTAAEYGMQASASARDVFAKLREIEDRIIKEFIYRAYSYNLQFTSREEFIKIVGKEAAETLLKGDRRGVRAERDLKEMLRGDYDFIPLGVTQIENKVVKGQQLINFLNLAGKLPPGIVDIPKLVQKIWKVVGDGDNIVIPQPTDTLVSPQDENILMAQGEAPHAKPMENHNQHLLIHIPFRVPVEFEPIKIAHISEHTQIIDMMAQAQLQAAMPPGGGVIPPQEMPRVAPEELTEAMAAKIPGLPVMEVL